LKKGHLARKRERKLTRRGKRWNAANELDIKRQFEPKEKQSERRNTSFQRQSNPGKKALGYG